MMFMTQPLKIPTINPTQSTNKIIAGMMFSLLIDLTNYNTNDLNVKYYFPRQTVLPAITTSR